VRLLLLLFNLVLSKSRHFVSLTMTSEKYGRKNNLYLNKESRVAFACCQQLAKDKISIR
jgi:hypothetical protein